MWHTHSLERYLATKRNEVQIHITVTLINLNITLMSKAHLYYIFIILLR